MVEIPNQLKDKRFRFVKVQEKRKRPYEDGWQDYNNYKFDEEEFREYLKEARSYGILCTNGLAIIDVDNKEKDTGLLNKILIEGMLPKTFTVKTGSGGYHFYYLIPELTKKIVLQKEGKHFGEVQAGGKAHCVGPGSIHPNGNTYNIDNDTSIKKITLEQLETVISDYYEKKNTAKFETVNTGLEWDISRLIEPINKLLVQQGRAPLETKDDVKYRGGHPVESHGSETGHNFEIDVEKNTWFCFRCERGGDALSLIAMLEGMTDKGMCPGRGFFNSKANKEKFLEIKKAGIDTYGFPDDGFKTSSVQLFAQSDKNRRVVNENIYQYLKDHNHKFITVRDETGRQPHIYYYQDGYYKLNGEDILVEVLQNLFNEQGVPWQRKYKLEILDYLKSKEIKERNEVAPPKGYINFNNGVYNIYSGKLLPQSSQYFFLYKIPWDYNPKIKKLPTMLQKFFESTFDGKQKYIDFSQELFGYCLYSDYNYPGLFYLYGTGGNGKSVWLSLLTAMLGEKNIASKSIDSLMSHRFTTALLYGKLLNYCGELTDSVMNKTDMLKRLTAGDKIQAEFKGKDGFDFRNIAKVITACNSIPMCYDRTDGWYERQYILPFLIKFRDTDKCDNDLLDKLITKENMESLLYWSLQGLHRLLKNKKFTYSNKKEKYLMYQGNTKYYVETNYVKTGDINEFVKVDDIRKDYEKWCKVYDVPIDSSQSLAMAFRYLKFPEAVLISEDNKKIYVRYGIKKVN